MPGEPDGLTITRLGEFSAPEKVDDTGFDKAPARYMATGREAIDQIRDELGDEGFIAFCIGTALKYRLRAGHKGPASVDNEKERWYAQMALHVQGYAPDPRANRSKT